VIKTAVHLELHMAKKFKRYRSVTFNPPEKQWVAHEVERARLRAPDNRPRVSVPLSDSARDQLDALAAKSFLPKSQIMRDALHAWLQSEGQSKPVQSRRGKVIIRNVSQTLLYARAIIGAIDEATGYDRLRHHNQPPPALWIDETDYLTALGGLSNELKRLNKNLEEIKKLSATTATASTEENAILVKKHINTFLEKYVGSLGKGSGYLTIALMGSLLYQLGLPETIFLKLLKAVH
jgi:hypothetical protein